MDVTTFLIGEFYKSMGVYNLARYSFRIAAERGHIPATRELGILLIQGKGGEMDIYEGSTLLHLAEEAGDIIASLALDSYLEF